MITPTDTNQTKSSLQALTAAPNVEIYPPSSMVSGSEERELQITIPRIPTESKKINKKPSPSYVVPFHGFIFNMIEFIVANSPLNLFSANDKTISRFIYIIHFSNY